jgi:hypothetical protein
MMTEKPELTSVDKVRVRVMVLHATLIFAHNSSRKEYYLA